jgi:hypothetical protein
MAIYNNPQDRNSQPKRAGGNSAEHDIEKHGQKRATKIGIQGIGGAGTDTGLDKSWGAQRDGGGNCATAASAIEKHGKPQGREFVDHENGPGGVKHALIPENIQVDDRGKDLSGNSTKGGREKEARGSERVPASRRFDS